MEDHADEIGLADFKNLFCALDLSLSQNELDRLFAMTDLNGSGFVTLHEFEGAWDSLIKEVVQKTVREMGLSPSQIVATVVLFVCLLILLLSFVLVTLNAYIGGDDFGAIVQSALVATLGKGVTSVRKRSKAEGKGKDLDEAIDKLIGDQQAAAAEDE